MSYTFEAAIHIPLTLILLTLALLQFPSEYQRFRKTAREASLQQNAEDMIYRSFDGPPAAAVTSPDKLIDAMLFGGNLVSDLRDLFGGAAHGSK